MTQWLASEVDVRSLQKATKRFQFLQQAMSELNAIHSLYNGERREKERERERS